MLFLDHTQVQYCKIQDQDKTVPGLIYNNNLFLREKAFPKEEIEAAIKECREEYLDHQERSQIPTLLVKEKSTIGIWMQNNQYKSDIIKTSLENPAPASSQGSSTSSSQNTDSNLNRLSVRQLAMEMHAENGGVEIKTRRHKLKLYQRCFLGNEAVDWMTKNAKVSREEAINLGQKMIDRGIFHHVLDEHKFEDKELFYRFNEDEGKSIWNSSL